jgi:hypothetical protein
MVRIHLAQHNIFFKVVEFDHFYFLTLESIYNKFRFNKMSNDNTCDNNKKKERKQEELKLLKAISDVYLQILLKKSKMKINEDEDIDHLLDSL